MDFVYWIIVIVLIVGVVWWLLNRSNSAKSSGSGTGQERPGASAPAHGVRADGALAGGSAAASAEAAATAGIPSAAGFGRAAEPAPPTTADDSAEVSATAAGQETRPAAEPASAPEPAVPAVPEPASAGPDEQAPASVPDSHHEEEQPMPDSRSGQAGTVRQDGSARQDDQAEWETQWSEASGSVDTSHGARPAAEPAGGATSAATGAATSGPPANEAPAHHEEYTGAHSPTLPGAETAAGEAVEEAWPLGQPAEDTAVPEKGTAVPENAAAAETLDRAESSAAAETAASHAKEPAGDGTDYGTGAEPAGHLAADQPYGEGSASPAPDGSGPADYTVKGDAGSMVYYEEGHPDYEQTRAEVWFESAAHAEAAGFRAPRRTRL
jgi:hypothetical protein